MKRFLLRFVLLLALVAGLDALCGFFFQGLTKSAIGGDTARNEYIANNHKDIYKMKTSSK